ncbi:hypothetical protein EV424DRAFT_1346553 [Suillus variegatus]|nr:hypothetical protein EV424DRAFT_1346553 [Suillus variegatus]
MNRPCVALTNNPGLKWKNPTPEPDITEFRIPDTRTPKPQGCRVTGYRVSGTRNSFRVPDTRTPNPARPGFRVRVSELGNRSEFRTPDTRTGSLGFGFGCPEFETRYV